MVNNGVSQVNAENEKEAVHPTLQKTFVILAIVSFGLGALVNFYTLKKLAK